MAPLADPETTERDRAGRVERWGRVLFALFLIGVFLGYAGSIAEASRRATDWMLIVPAGIVGAVLLLAAAASDLRARSDGPAPTAGPRRTLGLLTLLLAFAAALPVIGFDVATALFLAIAFWVQGERRIGRVCVLSVGGAVLMVVVFRDLLYVRLPTTVF